ncbi:ATPase family [mine drainage metagenome]|uniref:ATPase family n=1 Tax=mine drainage metagenome TaxID=410659 RepID=A0A1J5QYX0_9ZZZZ
MARDLDLTEELTTHILRNASIQNYVPTGGNLILAIQSPPGEGKTYHCKVVLGELGVALVRFPIADLESPGAGLPAVRLIEKYIQASSLIEKGMPAVLMIEDADLGIGNSSIQGEITQFTMNRGLITGTLMSLCDSPTLVEVPSESALTVRGSGRLCKRVPIIMTGNNLRGIYPALFRDGRARVIDWRASENTKVEYLQGRIPGARYDSVALLVKEFYEFPISSWESILELVQSSAIRDAVRAMVSRDDIPTLASMVERASNLSPRQLSLEDVRVEAGRHRVLRNEWSVR